MKSGTEISLSFSEDGCSALIERRYFQLGSFFDSDLNEYEEWIQDTLVKCDEILAGTTSQWTRDGNTCCLEIDRATAKITDVLFDGSAVSIPTEQFRVLVNCWLTIMGSRDGKAHRFSVDLVEHAPNQPGQQGAALDG